jgi:osmotically-inducible protein OsmY
MHDILLPKRRITRLFNATRHPDQAALVARLPVIGRRVPLRGYWKRQRIDPRRAWSHGVASLTARTPITRDRVAQLTGDAVHGAERRLPAVRHSAARARDVTLARLPDVQQRAAGMSRSAASAARSAAAGGAKRGRAIAARTPRGKITIAVAAFSIGALLVYFFDRASGRRRRALVRDKVAHMRRVVTRDTRRAVSRRGRFFRGVARGVRHDAAELLPHRHARIDDDTLVARVRSEVLRRASVPAGDVSVDVYEGCVTLRGQLDSESEIRRVVDATRHLDGVADVRCYLHLPGTPPPNKAEAMANGHAPAHMLR